MAARLTSTKAMSLVRTPLAYSEKCGLTNAQALYAESTGERASVWRESPSAVSGTARGVRGAEREGRDLRLSDVGYDGVRVVHAGCALEVRVCGAEELSEGAPPKKLRPAAVPRFPTGHREPKPAQSVPGLFPMPNSADLPPRTATPPLGPSHLDHGSPARVASPPPCCTRLHSPWSNGTLLPATATMLPALRD